MVKNFKIKTIRFFVLFIFCFSFLGVFLIESPTAFAQSSDGQQEIETMYFTPQIEIPFSSISGKTAVGSPDKDGFVVSDLLARYVKAIYDYGIMVGGILAALMLMAGGIIWLTSGGDSSKVSKAKDIITGSVTGVVILMGAYFILNTINPDLMKMKGVKMIVAQNVETITTTCCHEKQGKIKFTTRKIGNDFYHLGGEKDGEKFLGCQIEASSSDCNPPDGCYLYGGIGGTYHCYTKQNVCCSCRIGNSNKYSHCVDGVTEDECNKICEAYNEEIQAGKAVQFTLNILMPPAELFNCFQETETYAFCQEIK